MELCPLMKIPCTEKCRFNYGGQCGIQSLMDVLESYFEMMIKERMMDNEKN